MHPQITDMHLKHQRMHKWTINIIFKASSPLAVVLASLMLYKHCKNICQLYAYGQGEMYTTFY